jgi:hypothetical protein
MTLSQASTTKSSTDGSRPVNACENPILRTMHHFRRDLQGWRYLFIKEPADPCEDYLAVLTNEPVRAGLAVISLS